MCHLTRLTPAQQRTFDAMPMEYRRLLGDHIESAPPGGANARKLFDAWAERMQAVDNTLAALAATEDVITEAWETVDADKAARRRKMLGYARAL